MHYAGIERSIIHETTKLLYENNFMKEKCLRVTQGGYNINIPKVYVL